MKYDDFVSRPTPARIRKSEGLVLEKQIIPHQYFGTFANRGEWNRTDASTRFLKNAPTVDLYRGNDTAQMESYYTQTSPLTELVDKVNQASAEGHICPACTFRPVVGDRSVRKVYWDQLAFAADLLQVAQFTVRPYADAHDAQHLGIKYAVEVKHPTLKEKEVVVWHGIPHVKSENPFSLASKVSSSWQTTMTHMREVKYNTAAVSEAKVFDTIALAAYFKIAQSEGPHALREHSFIPMPTEYLVGQAKRARDEVVMHVPQTGSSKPKFYKTNQAEINRLLWKKIAEDPAKCFTGL